MLLVRDHAIMPPSEMGCVHTTAEGQTYKHFRFPVTFLDTGHLSKLAMPPEGRCVQESQQHNTHELSSTDSDAVPEAENKLVEKR